MLQFWKSKPPDPPAPPFDIRAERVKRRAVVLACELELQDATNAVKKYQGEHFSLNERGGRVPRVRAGDPLWVAEAEYRLLTLMQEVSRRHDAFQAALKAWSEIAT